MPIQILPNETRTGRRGFLAGLVAGAAGLGAGRSSEAGPRPDVWFALVSDTHIGADPAARLRGPVMGDNLRSVVADILAADTPPLGVVIDGDLALLDGRVPDYRTLVTFLEPLRAAKIPLHLALGNHDDRAHFRDALVILRRLQRRLAASVTVTEGSPCVHCGRLVPAGASGRRVLYCSRSCRQRAYERRKTASVPTA